jgi:hypothetical protein
MKPRHGAVARDATWREEAKSLLVRLARLADAIGECEVLLTSSIGDITADVVRPALNAVEQAHNLFFGAMNEWRQRHAPGIRNTGRRDPSRGGFATLGVALEQAYHAAMFRYLTLLGLTIYSSQVSADSLEDRVEEAFNLTTSWYADTVGFIEWFANAHTSYGQLGNQALYFKYCETVRDRHESAEIAFNELQPYLNGFAG